MSQYRNNPIEASKLAGAALLDFKQAIQAEPAIESEIRNSIKKISFIHLESIKKVLSNRCVNLNKDNEYSLLSDELKIILKIGLGNSDLYYMYANLLFQRHQFKESGTYCDLALGLDSLHTEAISLKQKLSKMEDSNLATKELKNPEKQVIIKINDPLVSFENPHLKIFIETLSVSLQNSLHEDRVFYQGKAGRRLDNLDRAIEVGTGAIDAEGNALVSLSANLVRVGVVSLRNLYTDMVAERTEEYGKSNIGKITEAAAKMLARRYARQIKQLDISDEDGVIGLARYFHNKAMIALHICNALKKIDLFWKWIWGAQLPKALAPEQKLFFAMLSDSGENDIFLRKATSMMEIDNWDAKELILNCGVEIAGQHYVKPKGSQEDKYGYCFSDDLTEINRRNLKRIELNHLAAKNYCVDDYEEEENLYNRNSP